MKHLEFLIKIYAGAILVACPVQAQYSELAGRDDIQAQQRAMLKRIEAQEARIQVLERELYTLRTQVAASSKTGAGMDSSSPQDTVESRPHSRTGMHTYVIQQGDTVNSIARQHGVSVQDLMTVNALPAPNTILIGSEIVIPGPGSGETAAATPAGNPPQAPATRLPDPRTPAPSSSTEKYIVRPGDTIARVASNHGLTINDIIAANKLLNPDRIAIGQELMIPGKGAAVTATPSVISTPTGPSVANAQKSTPPAQAPQPDPQSAPSEANPFPSGFAFYSVVPGDSLYSIARLFGTTEKELVELNKLGAKATIHPNQQILVPMDHYEGPYVETAAN